MTKNNKHSFDPNGLIGEAYRIPDLPVEDARAIFFDWVLGLPATVVPADAARVLLERHAAAPADHPVTLLLREAAEETKGPRQRRGRSARQRLR